MTYVMKMPSSYVDVSNEEMEYGGGAVWVPICAAISGLCFLGGLAVTYLNKTGVIDDNAAHAWSIGLGVVGTVTGIASGIGAINAARTMVGQTVGVMQCTADPALSWGLTGKYW